MAKEHLAHAAGAQSSKQLIPADLPGILGLQRSHNAEPSPQAAPRAGGRGRAVPPDGWWWASRAARWAGVGRVGPARWAGVGRVGPARWAGVDGRGRPVGWSRIVAWRCY